MPCIASLDVWSRESELYMLVGRIRLSCLCFYYGEHNDGGAYVLLSIVTNIYDQYAKGLGVDHDGLMLCVATRV